MRTWGKCLIAFVAASTFVALAYAAPPLGGELFRAMLTGDEEVPSVETDTVGAAGVKFNDDESVATFRLGLRNGTRVTQAHIHCAPEGTNGPIVAFLAGFHDRGWDVNGWWIGNAKLDDTNVIPVNTDGTNENPACPNKIGNLSELAQALRDGNGYVNVHSIAHPGGVVRGQLEQFTPTP